MNCIICQEEFTAEKLSYQSIDTEGSTEDVNNDRVPIKCQECKMQACNECYTMYFNEEASKERRPACMNTECRFPFDKYHLYDFIKSDAIDNIYSVLEYLNQKRLIDMEGPLYRFYNEMLILQKQDEELTILLDEEYGGETVNGISEEEYEDRQNVISDRMDAVRDMITQRRFQLHQGIDADIPRFKCAGCNRGIVNLKNTTCDLCNKETCTRCQQVVVPPHVCKTEDIDSLIEIEKNYVRCPTCLTPTSKIEGCNDMFCMVNDCRTPFSYKTGLIIKNSYYLNEDYIEFLENNPDTVLVGSSSDVNAKYIKIMNTLVGGDIPPSRKLGMLLNVYVKLYLDIISKFPEFGVTYMSNFEDARGKYIVERAAIDKLNDVKNIIKEKLENLEADFKMTIRFGLRSGELEVLKRTMYQKIFMFMHNSFLDLIDEKVTSGDAEREIPKFINDVISQMRHLIILCKLEDIDVLEADDIIREFSRDMYWM
jgi:hypothetical protein